MFLQDAIGFGLFIGCSSCQRRDRVGKPTSYYTSNHIFGLRRAASVEASPAYALYAVKFPGEAFSLCFFWPQSWRLDGLENASKALMSKSLAVGAQTIHVLCSLQLGSAVVSIMQYCVVLMSWDPSVFQPERRASLQRLEVWSEGDAW